MEAMYQALTMSAEERERRSTTLAQIIENEDIIHWIHSQLEEISPSSWPAPVAMP